MITELSDISSFRNPYIAGPPVIDPKMFFGREQALQQIINTLHNNNIMIIGPRRIGKTTLLHQLKNRLVSLNDPIFYFIPIIIDLQGVVERIFFHSTMTDIVTILSEYFSSEAIPTLAYDHAVHTDYSDRAFGRDLGKLINALQKNYLDKTIKLILLIDEMDVMNTYDQRVQSQLRSIFQKDFVRNLGAVVAGVDLRQKWERHESPFYNMFTALTLESFSPEQARQLIIKPVEGAYYYDDQAIARILAATGGHPFYLQRLCLETIQVVVIEKRKDITLADVEAALNKIEEEAKEANAQKRSPTLMMHPDSSTEAANQIEAFTSNTNETIRCQFCGTIQELSTRRCRKCGSYLLRGDRLHTGLLSTDVISPIDEDTEEVESDTNPLTVRLKIREDDQQIDTILTKAIYLGRPDPVKGIFPEVDLTNYKGSEKGVSRQHARILKRKGVVVVEDLGSLNGTFINSKRLAPHLPEVLHDGDLLRLGKLLIEVEILDSP